MYQISLLAKCYVRAFKRDYILSHPSQMKSQKWLYIFDKLYHAVSQFPLDADMNSIRAHIHSCLVGSYDFACSIHPLSLNGVFPTLYKNNLDSLSTCFNYNNYLQGMG